MYQKNSKTVLDQANKFVRAVNNYPEWAAVSVINTADFIVILDTLAMAGFEAPALNKGEIYPAGTLSNHIINPYCGFHVLDCRMRVSELATGWLDCAVRKASTGYGEARGLTAEDRAFVIASEMNEAQRRLAPIEIAPGEWIDEIPPKPDFCSEFPYFLRHITDGDLVGRHVGIHRTCGGIVIKPTSDQVWLLQCSRCKMDFTGAVGVKTYGELRVAAAHNNRVTVAA